MNDMYLLHKCIFVSLIVDVAKKHVKQEPGIGLAPAGRSTMLKAIAIVFSIIDIVPVFTKYTFTTYGQPESCARYKQVDVALITSFGSHDSCKSDNNCSSCYK